MALNKLAAGDTQPDVLPRPPVDMDADAPVVENEISFGKSSLALPLPSVIDSVSNTMALCELA